MGILGLPDGGDNHWGILRAVREALHRHGQEAMAKEARVWVYGSDASSEAHWLRLEIEWRGYRYSHTVTQREWYQAASSMPEYVAQSFIRGAAREQVEREPEARIEGHVIGYRVWSITPNQMLQSLAVGGEWRSRERVAKCLRFGSGFGYVGLDGGELHRAPHHACECGLYAHHDISIIPAAHRASRILGAVKASGRIEVHHDGFRSERMEILALSDDSGPFVIPGTAKAIARNYGVPTVPRAMLRTFAGEHGSPVPDELRPPSPF